MIDQRPITAATSSVTAGGGRAVLFVAAAVLLLVSGYSRAAETERAKDGCEVVSFDAYEERQAVLTPSGEYKVTAKKQCANLVVRNNTASYVDVGEIVVTAVFDDGSFTEGGFDPGGEGDKKGISPGETYSGGACLEENSGIRIMNCSVK